MSRSLPALRRRSFVAGSAAAMALPAGLVFAQAQD